MASSTGAPQALRPDPNRLGVGRFRRHDSSFLVTTVSLTPNRHVSLRNVYVLAPIVIAIRFLPLVVLTCRPREWFMTNRLSPSKRPSPWMLMRNYCTPRMVSMSHRPPQTIGSWPLRLIQSVFPCLYKVRPRRRGRPQRISYGKSCHAGR